MSDSWSGMRLSRSRTSNDWMFAVLSQRSNADAPRSGSAGDLNGAVHARHLVGTEIVQHHDHDVGPLEAAAITFLDQASNTSPLSTRQ
jgi:hypothetical protein